MIPSRNLLLGKMDFVQNERLLVKINNTLKSGTSVVLMVPNLQKYMVNIMTNLSEAEYNMEVMDNAEELNLTEHFLPLAEQADRLKKMLGSKTTNEYLKCQLPLTRHKQFIAGYTRLCRNINFKSEIGYKRMMKELGKTVNFSQLFLDMLPKLKQNGRLTRIVLNIMSMLERTDGEKLFE